MSIQLCRPRRNRKSEKCRQLIQETTLSKQDLVAPLFLIDGENLEQPINKMPGIYRRSLDLTLKEIERLLKDNIGGIALFPVIDPALKTDDGREAYAENGLIPRAIRLIKEKLPEALIFADIALDPYTTHGHDGVLTADFRIDNDRTVDLLIQQALCYAKAGCDILAPSDMMDGRILKIRSALEEHGYQDTGLLSYTAKYASSLYGPFRDAVQVSLSFGDKKSYQMNPANQREALLEAELDVKEGADMLMIKPASLYLDVIAKIKAHTLLPIAAYHVSGEYAMVMAAGKLGLLDPKSVFLETLISIKRAGADFIFTYAYDFVS